MKHLVIFSLIAVISFVLSFFIVASTYGIAAHTGILSIIVGCGVFIAVIVVILVLVSILDNDKINNTLFS